jgi:hypothetical protein
MRDLVYWVNDNWPGIAIIVVGMLLIGTLIGAGKYEQEQKDKFMQECLQDKKEYECTALWRAGSRAQVVIIQ